MAKKYADPFREGHSKLYPSAEYWGMLVNLDEKFGKLEEYLRENRLVENTIMIFVTDNGGAVGTDGERFRYNMGFRGKKKSKYDGGHTVPFFIRWPKGNLAGGQDRFALISHVDLILTFACLLDLKLPKKAAFDGIDISQVLLK